MPSSRAIANCMAGKFTAGRAAPSAVTISSQSLTSRPAEIAKGFARLSLELRAAIEARAREYIDRALIRGDRLPCPALEQGVCSIYEHRPLMCHKFGMPLYNPEKPDRIFACELNFQTGEEIEDPQLIPIQTRIHQEWNALQAEYKASPGAATRGPLTVAHAILRAASA